MKTAKKILGETLRCVEREWLEPVHPLVLLMQQPASRFFSLGWRSKKKTCVMNPFSLGDTACDVEKFKQ